MDHASGIHPNNRDQNQRHDTERNVSMPPHSEKLKSRHLRNAGAIISTMYRGNVSRNVCRRVDTVILMSHSTDSGGEH